MSTETALKSNASWLLLLVGCVATGLVTGAGMMRAPFLVVMSGDLRVTIADIGNLFTLTAVAWGAASLLAGIASDRFGRRPLLIGALLATGIALIGIGVTQSYALVAIWTAIAGAAGGVWMGTIMAEIADRVAIANRGRALGWVINGQSLALALGVPLATWFSPVLGWRGLSIALGVASTVMIAALLPALKARKKPSASAGHSSAKGSIRDVLTPRIAALLSAGICERVCFGLLAVYLPTYLIKTYDVAVHHLTLPLFLIALGNVVGNTAGAKLADKLRHRLTLFVMASIATAGIALMLFPWKPGLVASVALGCAYAFMNAVGRPAVITSLTEVPDKVRGTVMGVNMTTASFGWIGASLVGGLLIDRVSLSSLGVFAAATALLGAMLIAPLMWSSHELRERNA